MGYILQKDATIEICKQLRKHGYKIVFTHGVFDLFHAGHVRLFRESKKLGDVLVVGVESDEYIKKFKGKERPIFPAKQRLEIISLNSSVDFVFEIKDKNRLKEEYYLKLYRSLKPNVITAGKNFRFMKQFKKLPHGCKFVQISDEYDNLSSTDIISKIKEQP